MSNIDYLLHESSVGYALFQVVHQPDVVGNRLQAVRDAMEDLSRFGKMVKLVSFAPFQLVLNCLPLGRISGLTMGQRCRASSGTGQRSQRGDCFRPTSGISRSQSA